MFDSAKRMVVSAKGMVAGQYSYYHIHPKYKDRQARANSVDPYQTPRSAASDQNLDFLPFAHATVYRLNSK